MYTMVETSIKSPMQKSSTLTGESDPLRGKGNAPTQAEVKSKSLAPSQQRIKRPINSFLMWSQPERKKMLDKYPKMRNSEISKKLGANWKCLTDAQKKPFINEAKRLRVKYMSEYPGSKYAPRRKSKKIQITGQYSMPGYSGAYAFTQGQLGYIQNPSINIFPFQHTKRYGMRYGYMLAPPQAYMSPAPIFNLVPYAQQTSGIMNLGSTASGTESDSNSSLPITPHPQKLETSDMRDATSMPLSGDV